MGKKMEIAKKYGKPAAIVAGGAIVGAAVGAAILPAIGFGSAGVVASSWAAAWQASIGNVAAGSTFAACQSLAATGSSMVAASGAAIGAVVPYGKKIVGGTCSAISDSYNGIKRKSS